MSNRKTKSDQFLEEIGEKTEKLQEFLRIIELVKPARFIDEVVNSGRVQESTLCFCKDFASIYVTAAKTTAFIGARIREPKIHSRIL